MSVPATEDVPQRCLNCEALLGGPFCAACGQRVVPPEPTVRELVGDAWHEFTGYDGRLAHTIRALLFQPGRLTREFIEGHRIRYISPVRLYLTASILYFLVAVAAPNLDPLPAVMTAPGVRIGASKDARGIEDLDAAALRAQADRAPALLRPVLKAVANDPIAFRRRVFETMPRVFFALLPVFAGLTALFFRRRPFPTHLTFAAHLHAFVFIVLATSEVAKFSYVVRVAAAISSLGLIAIIAYGLMAYRVVYREPWGRTVGKALGIQVLYALAFLPAYVLIIAWASLT